MSFLVDIKAELLQSSAVLDAFINDEHQLNQIEKAAGIISSSINSGGKILSCGNGGSLCDAMHFAEELTGRYRKNRKPLPAIAISDPGFLTCTANDFGYDQVFSRFVEGVGKAGDVLFAISTSGNSTNVINAIVAAQNNKMKTIGLTGNDGGKMSGICDVEIRVPHSGYADRIQEVHIKVIHILIHLTEKQVS